MPYYRTFIILGLSGLILGGTAYFSYELFWKQTKLDREDRERRLSGGGPAAPDYTLPAFEKAAALERSGDVEGARAAWAEYLRTFPSAPKTGEAKAALGRININRIFSKQAGPDKDAYTVGRGDSLVKIAAKFKSNPELIYRVNNLESINLQVGQQLVIPRISASLVVDRKERTLTVRQGGEFLKEYGLVSLKGPGTTGAGERKVTEKFALKGTTRVAFGQRDYSESERWIMLGGGGLAIRSAPEGADPPPGIVVAAGAMEEIFVLVSRGTPVTIK